ncbi:hypothetical protein EV421DRAFT_1903504 [Armillaria borealis]|uniref:Uncharacterized protein n=1 Tax=Armillaria borealis TaxID=47425 RepID=A0AA39MQM4_9AGAR|nr:hypothetical protein EV421DRAFT_1903504 [Armillaria borealis]
MQQAIPWVVPTSLSLKLGPIVSDLVQRRLRFCCEKQPSLSSGRRSVEAPPAANNRLEPGVPLWSFRDRRLKRRNSSVVEFNNFKVGSWNFSKFKALRTLSPELEARNSRQSAVVVEYKIAWFLQRICDHGPDLSKLNGMITLMITIAMIQTTCASPIPRRVINISGVPDTGYDSIGIVSQETQPVGSDGDEAPKTAGGPPTQEVVPSSSRAGLPTAYVYETQEVPILAVEGTTYPSRMMIRSPSSTVYYGVESTSTPNISYVSSSCASTCNLSASNAILSATLSSVLTVLLFIILKWLRRVRCLLLRSDDTLTKASISIEEEISNGREMIRRHAAEV